MTNSDFNITNISDTHTQINSKDSQTQLRELFGQLDILHSAKADVTLDGSLMTYSNGKLLFDHPNNGKMTLDPSPNFISQICGKLDIPVRYYRKMESDGNLSLLDRNVNTYLDSTDGKRFFLRTYFDGKGGGTARALLSDSYLPIENLDVAVAFLDAVKHVQDSKGLTLQIRECSLTDSKMVIRVVCPDVQVEARKLLEDYRRPDGKKVHGDLRYSVFTGLKLTNSETGGGAFTVAPEAIFSYCQNAHIFKEGELRRAHIGKKLASGINWSTQSTKLAHDLALSQTQDAVEHYLTPEYLTKQVRSMEEWDIPLEHPLGTVQAVSNHLGYSKGIRDRLLNVFSQSGKQTAFGIAAAMTWVAHESVEDPDGNELLDQDTRIQLETQANEILPIIKQFDRELVTA